MKHYLLIIVSLIIIVLTGYYLYYGQGIYIGFSKNTPITTPFYIDNKDIYQTDEKKTIEIRGVEVDSSYGPKRGTDYSIDEKTYMRWFEQIQDMGANTIKVSTIYDNQFFDAFYEYNKNRKNPLYLIQGIRVATNEFETKRNIKQLDFYETLLKDSKDIVDIIHGRKILLTNEHKGSGFYFHDISSWVVGFLIGEDWDQEMISYLNHSLDREPVFKGKYVTTTEQASNFEIMMAEMIENIVNYESNKYHTQRPISVNSTFIMDPFEYQEAYAAQIEKINTFTIDHIQPTKKMKSGLFASYAYEDHPFDLLPLIKPEELKSFANVKSYFDLIKQAHEVPVIISSIGYPSESFLNNTQKQETVLLEHLKMFDNLKYNGTIIRSWQDVWDRRSLATSFAVDLQQISEWHDPLTSTQHFGLIGFQPYRNDVLMKVDGKDDDWQDVKASFQDENRKISMTRDHTYLYLWLEDPTITTNKPFYIGFDLHPKLGSKTSNLVSLTFDRNMDFLLQVDSTVGAKMYVHERYQGVRQNFLELTNGQNPYFHYPDIDSNVFEPMYYFSRNNTLLSAEQLDSHVKSFSYSFKEVHPLKTLHSDEVNADIAIENGRAEIRIPYQLLNVYDPLKFTIHDDYYKHYGVEPFKIDHFYISIGNENALSPSVEISVEPLKALKRVKEYIKPSYNAVQNYWKGED